MEDDRQTFEEFRKVFAEKLANDSDVQKKSQELYSLTDKHNYPYLWNWMGIPIIQPPSDILTMQEIIWSVKPDLIIETGVARGGSIVFYASLLALIGKGEVIGVDIDLRAHNRDSIEKSAVHDRIHLIQGSSTDEATFSEVKKKVGKATKVMVVLDSNHTHQHVLDELRLYAPLVTKDQYLIVTDTCIEYMDTHDTRGKRPWGKGNSPKTAIDTYLKECSRFQLDPFFNQRSILTSSPHGFFKCVN